MSDPILKLIHPLPEGIRSYPIRYRTLNPFFRNGSDPIRSDTGAYESCSGMGPTLSDPLPELIHYLPVCSRSYPIRSLSLYTIFRNGPDPVRSHTGAYSSSSELSPTISDPIPELIHYLPVRVRSYPIRSRSLYIFYRTVSDPIRSDAEAYTSSPGMDPIISDPIPKLMPHSSEMDPSRSDPIPKLTHLLPEWARPYPTRYLSLYIISRCGSDPIRSEAGAYTSVARMYPILSDPIPEFVHYLSEGTRSCPIRYRSFCTLFRKVSDPIR